MSGEKIHQLEDGEAVKMNPDREHVIFYCCDCGLAHRLNIIRHRKTHSLTLQWIRDNRRTANHRRKKGQDNRQLAAAQAEIKRLQAQLSRVDDYAWAEIESREAAEAEKEKP